jgi:hypothetical protein
MPYLFVQQEQVPDEVFEILSASAIFLEQHIYDLLFQAHSGNHYPGNHLLNAASLNNSRSGIRKPRIGARRRSYGILLPYQTLNTLIPLKR